MKKDFEVQLRSTLYVHAPIEDSLEGSIEEALAQKVSLARETAAPSRGVEGWESIGAGQIKVSPSGNATLVSPTSLSSFPPDARDTYHTHYGRSGMRYALPGFDARGYNQLCVTLRASSDGHRRPHLHICLENEGEIKIPDKFDREGTHQVNLECGKWTRVIWEIPDLPRDRVSAISFYSLVAGRDTASGEYCKYEFSDISWERVELCEASRGWLPNPGQLCACFSGYAPGDLKLAVGRGLAGSFVLKSNTGEMFSSPIRTEKTPLGEFSILDFSHLRAPGDYMLTAPGAAGVRVRVRDNPWRDSAWKALNFLFCERCGYPVPGRHGICHTDVIAEFRGLKKAYFGGWHDAADLSQQTTQSAEITTALLRLSRAATEPALKARILEEALWGVEFVLRSRLSDGYRMTSAGITRWTNGVMGDMDDGRARVANECIDNYICSITELEAYRSLDDEGLRIACLRAAREDYAFARAKFETGDILPGERHEHTYTTSLSVLHAAAGLAAIELYSETDSLAYLADAVSHAEYVVSCQETDESVCGIAGFFYRDSAKTTPQHFNHQSREEYYMRFMRALASAAPHDESRDKWLACAERYANYLKAISEYTEPFGMLPSGVYAPDEPNDIDGFNRQHPYAGEEERALWKEELKSGWPLKNGFYLRAFPIWFSFRGNAAVMLSSGIAAAECAEILADRDLLDIAANQLRFMTGLNPFAQSLIYGEGDRYACQYAVHPGEMVGAMPVGIQTLGTDDAPYWPQAANATYKEVWTTTAGKWLMLLAESGAEL